MNGSRILGPVVAYAMATLKRRAVPWGPSMVFAFVSQPSLRHRNEDANTFSLATPAGAQRQNTPAPNEHIGNVVPYAMHDLRQGNTTQQADECPYTYRSPTQALAPRHTCPCARTCIIRFGPPGKLQQQATTHMPSTYCHRGLV